MDIEIEFISVDKLSEKTEKEKVDFIIQRIKSDKILVLEEPLSPGEEAMLIESTMRRVSESFPGIEISRLGEKSAEGLREKIIKMLGGNTGGLSVIGPSKIVKKIKKEPQKISVLAGSK